MFQKLIDKLTRHEDLTTDEAAAAMVEVMEGRATPAQIAGLLIGLAMKGERPAEIVGLARTMRAHAVQVSRRHERVFDTCGTGGDGAGTFNISTCAALIVAACGVPVAKHGNRAASSLSGSADGIDELSTTGYTKISECRNGAVNTFYLHPADVGLPKATAASLKGGNAHENAKIIERILGGERGAPRDVVLLNAGAALFIAGETA